MRLTATALAALIIGGAANAQIPQDTEVHRCPGNVYQAEPCKHGRQLEIDSQQNIMDRERRRPTGAYDGDGPSVLMIPMEPFPAKSTVTRETRSTRTVIIRRNPTPQNVAPPRGNTRAR